MVATEAAQGNVYTYVHLKGGLHVRQVKSIWKKIIVIAVVIGTRSEFFNVAFTDWL
jgi:hypothetical protein